jgi:hypothetical protein
VQNVKKDTLTGSQQETLSLWGSCTESSEPLTETSVSHKETTGFRTGNHLNGTGYGSGEERLCRLLQNWIWQQNAAKTHKSKTNPSFYHYIYHFATPFVPTTYMPSDRYDRFLRKTKLRCHPN